MDTGDYSLPLSDEDRTYLDFERLNPGNHRYKMAKVWDTFGHNERAYWQRLNSIADNPAALVHDPVTVNRLRRIRSAYRP